MKQYIDKENELSKLANEWKKERKWENISIEDLPDKEYIVSLKIDGELTAFEYKDGEITYSSRHGKVRKNLPFDSELINKLKKYKKVIGFGELYAVDKNGNILPYTQSMSILRKPTEDNIDQIRFKIFDIYQINDKKIQMPYIKRMALIKKILQDNKFFINAIKSHKNKISDIFNKYVKSGKYEGLVVWDNQKTYKIKEFINLDAVVIFVEKSDKHPDRMGALGLALFEDGKFYYIGNVGTGFTEEQRIKWLKYALKNKKKEQDGRIFIDPKIIIEVNAKSLNAGTNIIYNKQYEVVGDSEFGSLREPKFVRIRKDKDIKEGNIGLSQIENFIKKSYARCFMIKKALRYKENYAIDEELDGSLFSDMLMLKGSKSVKEIVEKAKKILKLNNKESAILDTPDGIAYLTQIINYAAKRVDDSLYEIKNILTRWLSRNHPLAYFDKEKNILYVNVGEGQQLSFHVGHDIGVEGDGQYKEKVNRIYKSRMYDPEIKFDGRYRQDMSDYGLYNYLYRRNDNLDPIILKVQDKFYVHPRGKDESYGPFETIEKARDFVIDKLESEGNAYNNNFNKTAAFETNTLQIRIEGQLKDDIINFAKRNFLQKYLYYNTNLYILGRVYNPHITLMYFKKDIFKEIVRHLKEKGVEYIEFTLGNIKKFSSDKDVFYIEVRSEQLDNLANELAERFDEQQPFKFLAHIALAYVKNGTHDFLLNNAHFQGIKYKTSIIEVSYYDNNKGGEYYNLKNNDTGKVVDFLYKHNIDVSKIKPGNVGFDFDYTLTMNPNQFKKIIDHIHSNGYKVFIITGRGPSLISYINEFLNKNNINVDGVYNFEKELTDEDFVNPETKKQIAKFKKDKIKELEISTFFDDDFFVISNLPNNIDKYFVPAGVQKVNNGKFIYPEKSHNKFEQIINKLLYVANKYGYKIYAAGGYVRDLIMDRDSKDLDIIVVKDSEGVNAPIEFAKKVKEEFGDNIYE